MKSFNNIFNNISNNIVKAMIIMGMVAVSNSAFAAGVGKDKYGKGGKNDYSYVSSYDKYGYDKYGYDKYGYDKYGKNKYGKGNGYAGGKFGRDKFGNKVFFDKFGNMYKVDKFGNLYKVKGGKKKYYNYYGKEIFVINVDGMKVYIK